MYLQLQSYVFNECLPRLPLVQLSLLEELGHHVLGHLALLEGHLE